MRATYRTAITLLIAVLLLSSGSFAATIKARYHSHRTTYHRARHVRWTPVLLKGSHDSLLRQNAEIDRLQLPRIANDAELEDLVAHVKLVPIVETSSLHVDPRLEPARRYCRPWTRDFLEEFSHAYYKQFHQPIQVNSAVRTVEQQLRLARTNHNAAPAEGETASSHLAGGTVDIAKHGMNRRQRAFVEGYLVNMRNLGLVEAVEERRQACFHVMVFDRYTAWRDSERVVTAPPAPRASSSAVSPQQ